MAKGSSRGIVISLGSDEELDDEDTQVPDPSFRHPSMSFPSLAAIERSSLLQGTITGSPNYGTLHVSPSWSTTEGIHPYTRENRPNRRPFHLPPARRISAENDSLLYTRFRYYSRLRAPACPTDDALVIPDHVVPVDFFLPYIPGQRKGLDGKQNSYITIIAIWNTMMGTSLLTMPWAFGQAGFLGGFLIMFGMGTLCLYTAYRILTLQKTMGLEGELHEVGYLCRYLWEGSVGKAVEGIAVTFSVITLLGAQVVYWVLMSNFLYNTGEAIYGIDHETAPTISNSSNIIEVLCPPNITQNGVEHLFDPDSTFQHFWKLDLSVPLLLVIPFAFLLNIRNPAIFTYFNSFGAISVIAMYAFVVVKAFHWGFHFSLTDEESIFFVPLFRSSFMALSGTLSLAYFIHNCIITIMKGNRHQENNVRDLSMAYILVALTYIPIGVVFYLTFPLPKFCLVPNFLDNFPPHNLVLAIVRGFLLFQMLTVYPLLTSFVRAQLLTYFLGPGTSHSWLQISIVNITLVTICVLFAIFYPNIGFLIRWVGALAGLAYVFVLPCVSHMQAQYSKEALTWKQILFHTFIIVLGVVNFTAQFFL